MLLLRIGLAVEEQCSLAEMIEEACTACTHLMCVYPFGMGSESAILHSRLERAAATEAVWVIAGLSFIDGLPHMSFPLVIMYVNYRPVDRYLMKVRSAKAYKLGICIGEKPSLQQRIVGKIYSRNNMPDVKSNLLGLSKEIIRVPVKCHLPYSLHRNEFFRYDLRRIQQIEVKLMFICLLHYLYT